jgi:16S rRNA processing protein RimM
MIAIGRIGRPHGTAGTVHVTPLSDHPDRFRRLNRVSVEKGNGTVITLNIESVKGQTDKTLVKFRGVDSPEQAEELRDGFILIARNDVPSLPEDTYYVFDLVGYEVETEEGDPVGILTDVQRFPASDLYLVRGEKGDVLIPAVRQFVRVDSDQRKIFVQGIEELLE